MEMTPVDSSNVKAIGYEPETSTLAIEFRSGGTYHYHDVTPDDHKALADSDSKGKHFHQHIRGHFNFSKTA